MADHLLKFKPGQAVTFTATTAITGGQVVEVTGNRSVGVPTSAASAKAIGTAGHDVASGDQVIVHLPGPVDTAVAAAAIAAGANVEAATLGKVQTATTGRVFGIALSAATAADQTIQVLRA
jgi:predicted RecA/RadA family phage recombinase